MATARVTINAIDNMSATLQRLQNQLNQLQATAGNINVGGGQGGGNNNAAAQAARQAAREAEQAERRLREMFSSLGDIVMDKFVSSLKSALSEIQKIDDELVVVRRITGKTSKELEGMTKHAHEVASKYGVAASDYLQGVSTFTRAGYGEQAEDLAELSVKLQRAGDVTADVANAYMTAVDKAYNFQGSVEALSAAMDGANQIGNEYATNVAEIAAGIGKVASIAATGHVGIDELTAALGTITAVTQRSGNEAATALRAIFLNIMGDTTTEIEEGAKWTAGEIEGLSDVLKMYAPEVVAAAEATNSLIDPMVAIGALADSYEKGILTESKLFTMVSDIGGKLRTNQLMVLIKNWKMYEDMLNTFHGATGSIDREIANSMDSITVKIQQIQNTWTAMVNDTISQGLIKGVLDGVNTAIKAVGNLGNALQLVLGIVTMAKSRSIGQFIADLFAGGSHAAAAGFSSTISSVALAVTAVAAAVSIANGIIQAHNERMAQMAESAEKQGTEAERSSNEILKLYTAYVSATAGSKEYETALRALAEALGLTAEQAQTAEQNITALTQNQLRQAVADAKAAMDIWSSANKGKWGDRSFNIVFGEEGFADADIARIVNQYYEQMSQYAQNAWKDEYVLGASWTLRANEDAERLVAAYELARKMQQEMNMYGLDHGIADLTDIPGYDVLSGYLTDMEDTYESARTVVDAYASAVVNSSIQVMTATSQIALANADLADGTADAFNDEQIREFGAAMDALANSYDRTTFMGQRQYETVMKRFAEMFPNLVKYSKEYQEYMKETTGVEATADGAEKAAGEVDKLAKALNTATKAKEAFDAAMKSGESKPENAGFKDYQSAYAAYAAEIEAGRVNSRIAMAAAEYLMAGSSKYNFAQIFAEKGFAGINEAMKKGPWKTVFGDAEKEYGEGFMDLLGKVSKKNGDLVNGAGEVIGSYKKVGKETKFVINDIAELAEELGMPIDQVWQSIEALRVYGKIETPELDHWKQTLAEMGESAGITSKEVEGVGEVMSVNYEQLRDWMRQNGTEAEWNEMKQWLDFMNETGQLQITKVPEGWQDLDDWAEETAEATESAAESMEQARESAEQATGEQPETPAEETKNVAEAYKEVANAETNFAMQAAADAEIVKAAYAGLAETLDSIDWDGYTLTIGANGEEVYTTIQTIESEAGVVTRTRTITFGVDGNAYQAIHDVEVTADGVVKERDITYNANGDIATFQEVETFANSVSRTRNITYDALGNVETFAVVERDADGAAETRIIHYNADGTIDKIEVVKGEADDAAAPRMVYYYTDGIVTGIENTYNTADGPVKETHTITYNADGTISGIEMVMEGAGAPLTVKRTFHYDADGNIAGIEQVTQNAAGVTTEIRTFKYGADGTLLTEELVNLDAVAGAPTKIVKNFIYGADGTPLVTQITTISEEADGATKETRYYIFDGNGDGVIDALDEAEGSIIASTDTDWGQYELDGVNTEVLNAVKTAEDAITKSTEKDYDYTIGVNFTDSDGKPLSGDIVSEMLGLTGPASLVDKGAYSRNPRPLSELLNGPKSGGATALPGHGSSSGGDDAGLPARPGFTVEADFHGGAVTVPGEVEFEPVTDKEVQEEVTGGKPIELKTIPKLVGNQIGETVQNQKEDGTVVYTASFEMEDSDAVLDIFAEINEATGEVHRVKILTEADGTQTIEEYTKDVDGLEKTHTVTIDAEGNAITDLETADELASMLERTVTIGANANTSAAMARLNALQVRANSLNGRTITITTKVQGDQLPKVEPNAQGTDSFNGGLALVNDGKGPELVVHDGEAKIYGNGKPTIAAIPKGAKIYTAEETAEILGGIAGMRFPAFAKGTSALGGLTIPEKKEEEKKEEEKKESGDGSGSSDSKEDENKFWDTIREYLDYGLKKIQYAVQDYEQSILLLERARDKILEPIDSELEDLAYSISMIEYEVKLLERARDDAVGPLDDQIEKLKEAQKISREDEALEEKKLAVEKARADLQDAMHQRTVRYFNEETGQWEWMADQKAIDTAKKALEDAEKSLAEAEEDYAITLLERERDAIEKEYQAKIDEFEDREKELERRQEDLEHQKEMITREYDLSIKPLQKQMDELQQQYDDLQRFYDRLVDAVEVPTESLTGALREMSMAAAEYRAQLADTIKLLDAVYERAPTWSAIQMGDLGGYLAKESTYGDYTLDQSTTVTIGGVEIRGHDADTMTAILKKQGLYK